MIPILHGRTTALYDGPFVVFLVGIRVNRWWAFHRWVPALRALKRMIHRLNLGAVDGFLGSHRWYNWREIMVVQYWTSFESLEQFARNNDDLHRPNWKWYVKQVEKKGWVGVWHESFQVEPRQYECVYTNMPLMGFAAATTSAKAGGKRELVDFRKKGQMFQYQDGGENN